MTPELSADAPPVFPRWCRLLLGWPGFWLAFAWGFAEGFLFFIVPDLALTLTALFSPRKAAAQTAAVVAGSLLAGTLLFSWAAYSPSQAKDTVSRVPFVTETMAAQVRQDLDAHGATALLMGPMSGIPYKIYAVEAPERMGLPLFLAASIPARLERLLSGLLLFGVAGWILRKSIHRRPAWALAGHGLYWLAIYAFYWGRLL